MKLPAALWTRCSSNFHWPVGARPRHWPHITLQTCSTAIHGKRRLIALGELADFKSGDRVKTLKGSMNGKILRVLPKKRSSGVGGLIPARNLHSAGKLDSPEEKMIIQLSTMNPQLTRTVDATIPPSREPCEGFKRPWPPLIKMDDAVQAKVEKLFGGKS